MAGFRKAKAEQAALKIGIYGAPGSGKTFTTLLCAEGIAEFTKKRIAFVDTERGTDFYCKDVPTRNIHPQAFDFDAIYTRSITEVIQEVKAIDTNVHSVVVIDSITHIWEAARLAYRGRETSAGTIPFQAWAQIKKPYKELINFLMSSPLHVFILGRQGNEFDKDEETGELSKVGVKMKSEGETPYEPHILIHMEAIKNKNGIATITAFAEKDRTGTLAGKTIFNPDFNNIIKPIIPLLGGKQAVVKSEEENAITDSEKIEEIEAEKTKKSSEILKDFNRKIILCNNAEDLKKIKILITPELKKEMTTNDVNILRDAYLDAERNLGKI